MLARAAAPIDPLERLRLDFGQRFTDMRARLDALDGAPRPEPAPVHVEVKAHTVRRAGAAGKRGSVVVHDGTRPTAIVDIEVGEVTMPEISRNPDPRAAALEDLNIETNPRSHLRDAASGLDVATGKLHYAISDGVLHPEVVQALACLRSIARNLDALVVLQAPAALAAPSPPPSLPPSPEPPPPRPRPQPKVKAVKPEPIECDKAGQGRCRGFIAVRACSVAGCAWKVARCEGHGGEKAAHAGAAGHGNVHQRQVAAPARGRRRTAAIDAEQLEVVTCAYVDSGVCEGEVHSRACKVDGCGFTVGRCEAHGGTRSAYSSLGAHMRVGRHGGDAEPAEPEAEEEEEEQRAPAPTPFVPAAMVCRSCNDTIQAARMIGHLVTHNLHVKDFAAAMKHYKPLAESSPVDAVRGGM